MGPGEKGFTEHLMEYASDFPDKKMLGGPEGWISVSRVRAMTEAVAWKFRELGVCSGDMVALRAERQVTTIITLLGLRMAGAVVVLTDPHNEVEQFLSDAAVPIPVSAVVEVAEEDIVSVGILGKTKTFPLRSLPHKKYFERIYDPRETAFLIFTSGSTGKRKAVMISEYNLVNNLVDSQPLGDYSEDDIALGALPLDHVFGLVLFAGTLVLRYGLYLPEKTDVSTILQAVQNERITRMNGVPSLYLAMTSQREKYNLSSLRAGFIAGGPVTPEQFCYIEDGLGMTLVSAYGMSECVGISCSSYRDPRKIRAAGVGPFYARNTGKILREDGSEAEQGEEGEICVDGPSRMAGYFGDNAPREPLFHTGDLGFVDEQGGLHITGRKKDIIIRNGNNLSPRRIEDALLKLSYIKNAVVVGLPDERQGEIPYAMVICEGDAPKDILRELTPLLAKNELPRGILRTVQIPMTSSGKPDKARVREVLALWVNG